MGAWFIRFPVPPFWALCLALSGQGRGGGARNLAVGVCTPRGAMRWPVLAVFWVYLRDGRNVPAPGSISVWLAAALTFGPFKGVPDANGTVEETVLLPVGPLRPPALGHGAAGWRVQGAPRGVCSPV